MKRFLKDFKKYGTYMVYAAKAMLKSELDGSRIGWIWWFLEPILFMLIYMFAYSIVFKRAMDYLVAFIFIGTSMWRFFNNTVQTSVQLIKRKRNIIAKVYLPKFTLVGSTMLTNSVKLLFSMLVVAGLMVYYQITPTWHVLQIIPVFAMLYLLTFGVSLLVMHVGVNFEDLANFITPAFQLLFYASGVFYSLDRAWDVAGIKLVLHINPIALALNEARNALLYQLPCDWVGIGSWSLISMGLIAVSLAMIYRSENEYIKLV